VERYCAHRVGLECRWRLFSLCYRSETRLPLGGMAGWQIKDRLRALLTGELARLNRVRKVLETETGARNSMPNADWLELTW